MTYLTQSIIWSVIACLQKQIEVCPLRHEVCMAKQ
jgi:hypothetical protein